MNRPPDPDATCDPTGQAVGFSVLQALGAALPEVPHVQLREPDHSTLAAPSAAGDPPEPTGAPGRYHSLEEIDRGGMGAVLRGRDGDLGREIAVKVLLEAHQGKPGMLLRFIEEAQIGGQLQHPGIVPVYELGTFPDRRPYFTMKLVKGRTLAQVLKDRADPAADLARWLAVFQRVCQTLAYAHSRGVIHRDLKPANVMVGAFGEVYVMDWGLAKVLDPTSRGRPPQENAPAPAEVSVIRTRRGEDSDAATSGNQTQAGSVLGTPAYMPPEQALGEVERLDERADVFGLGAILCEVLTGQPPYVGADGVHLLRKAVRADLADAFARLDACGADAELVRLAKRCLAAEPGDRPRDAGVLAGEVTAHLESVETRLRQAELAGAEARARAVEERKRRKLAVALGSAVLALVLLGGGGGFYLTQQRAERERELLARQGEAARQVQEMLSRADGLRRQARADNDPARWAEARALADRARGLLADLPPGHELAGRVETLAGEVAAEDQDRRLLARLEEAWLLRAEADAQAPGFALRRSLREYAPLFAEHGLRVGAAEAEAAGWVLRRPPQTRERLLGGLDAWLGLARQLKGGEAAWLLGVLQAADKDAWRRELRAAVARDDLAAVDRLAQAESLGRQPPETVLLLADYFRPRSQAKMIDLLRAAQARHPADFWLNFALADALYQKHYTAISDAAEFEDAVRFFATALALRPNNLHVETLLGWSLWLRGRRAEGRAVLEQARARRPDYFGPHAYLGYLALMEGKDQEAEAAYRQALRLQPRSGWAHAGLGFVFWGRGQHAEALLAFRRASRFEPFPRGILAQAALLAHLSRLDECAAVCRQFLQVQPDFAEAQLFQRVTLLGEAGRPGEGTAIARGLVLFQPNNPEAHLLLHGCLLMQSQLDEALAAARNARKVSPKAPTFPVGLIENYVREGERLVALGPHLAAYAAGERKPRDAHELVLLMFLCYGRQQKLAAAQIHRHAFDADPRLAEDVTHERRYDAARYAAQAAAGLADAAKLGETERADWRRQALAWLRADLAGWRKRLADGSEDDRALARERLHWWREDAKLATLRDPAALAALPPDDRAACERLWAEVAALLADGSP